MTTSMRMDFVTPGAAAPSAQIDRGSFAQSLVERCSKPVCSFAARVAARQQRGITLIELMVAMLIGLLLTLAMVSALTFGESQKRTTSATSDMDQSGAYAASVLDTALRNAGAGLMQTSGIIGCNPGFEATLDGTPFEAFGAAVGVNSLRVAPVLIAQNPSNSTPASDVLVVMGGAGAAGGIPRTATGVTGNQVTLTTNTVGITAPSLALVTTSAGSGNCSIQNLASVDTTNTTQLTFAALPASLGPGSVILPLGSQATGDVQFQLLGVDTATGTLDSYDLLPNVDHPLQPLTSNVLAMQALYGISNGNGQISQWVAPTGNYAIANLLANPGQLSQIVAIRVALVLKGSLYERDPIAAAPPTWFTADPAGTPLTGVTAQTLDLSAITDGTHYRYRVIEFVVPVRNNLLN